MTIDTRGNYDYRSFLAAVMPTRTGKCDTRLTIGKGYVLGPDQLISCLAKIAGKIRVLRTVPVTIERFKISIPQLRALPPFDGKPIRRVVN